MSRSVDLWVGKTDDAPIPRRVRIRVFDREGGRCWLHLGIKKPGRSLSHPTLVRGVDNIVRPR